MAGFTNGASSANEYLYDANGNMIRDDNKGITNIIYNHLNLPEVITLSGGTITFLYDANGNKLQKTVNGSTQDYLGGIEYKDNVVEAVYHEEGRATPSGSDWQYEYSLKDHLGNTRIIFSDTNNDDIPEILQEADYYPFGMRHASSTTATNHYLYNGKELNTDLGLDWYDYGFRWYDAEIGRWSSIDLMAESYASMSPFNYVANNPIRNIDPDGQRILPIIKPFSYIVPIPLTTKRLRSIGKEYLSSEGVVFNRELGKAFEVAALHSNHIPLVTRLMPSTSRRIATKGKVGYIMPDAILPALRIDRKSKKSVSYYPRSVFVEVKAVGGTINLSYDEHQIRGMINALARSPAAASKDVKPALFFYTTSDTQIGKDVIKFAKEKKIEVYQSVAWINENDEIAFDIPVKLTGGFLHFPLQFPFINWVSLQFPAPPQLSIDPDPEVVVPSP